MPNLLSRYFWWTEERGSLHYDVMVTLILIFMFVAPRFIDFKDRPVETVALNSSEVLVRADGQPAATPASSTRSAPTSPADRSRIRTRIPASAAILRVIEPISGAVTLQRYEPVYDTTGKKVIAYNAWVVR